MNIHLQLKMYTFIFRRCLLFIFRPFYELVEMNLMHEKIFYTLQIMEWKTFFQSCGFSDLYAEQYAKLFLVLAFQVHNPRSQAPHAPLLLMLLALI